jgi:hypothetical protein
MPFQIQDQKKALQKLKGFHYEDYNYANTSFTLSAAC